MKKKQIPYSILILSIALVVGGAALTTWKWNTWFGNPPEAAYATPPLPDRILLTLGEEAESSRRISWRCDTLLSQGYVELTGGGRCDTVQLAATGTLVESRSGKSAFYQTELTRLRAGETYRYRVKNGERASDWRSFGMPATTDSLSFIYLGDIQDSPGGESREVFQAIRRLYPDVDFWALGGDVIERPTDLYWSYWYATMDSIAGITPLLAAAGNHEYLKGLPKTIDPRWIHTFSNPENGPKGFEGRSYSVGLGELLFVVLDTDGIQGPLSLYRHWAWLGKTLAQSDSKWTVVMMHHPVYSVREGRNNFYVRWTLKPLFEKYGVDLVLQGHDHGYSRITTKEAGEKQPPVYIVSSASAKCYKIGFDPIHDREGSNLLLGQYITLVGDTLRYTAFAPADNQVYDHLAIIRRAGRAPEVIDYAWNLPESLALPPAYQGNRKKAEAYRQKAEERSIHTLLER